MSGHRHSFERYGPDGPCDDRTGNEIVNNGPDTEPGNGLGGDRSGGSGAGRGGSGAGFGGPGDLGDPGDGLGGEEAALRRLLHGVVEDIEPSDGALDHLRRAVPARRARKRQALVGMAAAALLVGTAVPAFVHVAGSGAGDSANPVNAGHGEQAHGGTGDDPDAGDAGKGTEGPSAGGEGNEQGEGNGTTEPGEQPSGAGDGASGAAQSPGAGAGSAPVCDSTHLVVISAQTNAPDGEGKVYGTFRVANNSQSECAVSTSDVTFSVSGAADPTKITMARHVTGDAAGALPDPSQELPTVVLKPSAAYEVKFGWVPSDSCPTTDPSPDPSPSDGTPGDSSGTGTSDQTTTQLFADGGVQDGSVTVSHPAQGGAATATTTVTNACAGTIYHTGLLPGQ
ncbi:hypothetical protein [Streptomyces sp. NPDC002187]|uniref:hypothetical protein n=1 Tax=Streptomyces sp. NPDC002187 TaxID=3364637 RepID=UPI0036BC12AA